MAKRVKKGNYRKRNTGLFIDGENVGSGKAELIMQAAKEQGVLFKGYVYGILNDAHTRKWSDKAKECGFADIRLHGGPEKNKVDKKIKTDVRKMIEENKNVDIFCIATSDKGFKDIVLELKSMGKRVVVIGEKKAPLSLRASCNAFIEI